VFVLFVHNSFMPAIILCDMLIAASKDILTVKVCVSSCFCCVAMHTVYCSD